MPDTEERNLELTPRSIDTRDRRPIHTIQFQLSDITNRFSNNLLSIYSVIKYCTTNPINGGPETNDIVLKFYAVYI